MKLYYRKGKIIPQYEWIKVIEDYCLCENIPLFLKDNLNKIIPFLTQQFPEGIS